MTRTLGADGKSQRTSVVLYDGMLRPFQQQVDGSKADENDRGRMVSHAYYDSAGRATRSTSPWWVTGAPALGALIPEVSPPSTTWFTYDQAGRVTKTELKAGTTVKSSTRVTYNGAETTTEPQGGTVTKTLADAHGRIVKRTEYGSPATPGGPDAHTINYVYDVAGRMSSMTDDAIPDGKNDTWLYEYNRAGQVTLATDPDAGTTKTTYTPLGQVYTTESANKAKLEYTYDPLGRRLSLRDANAVVGQEHATQWEYDQAKLPGGKTALGQVSKATRIDGSNRYTTTYDGYDTAYRPTAVTTQLPADPTLKNLSGASFTTSFGYTADGQLSKLVYPEVKNGTQTVLGKETVNTRYDAASMPSWMSGGFGWGTYVAQSAWAVDGTLRATDLGNTYGAVVSYAWDTPTGRLESISLDRENKTNSQGLSVTELHTTYGYDAVGNVTSMIDTPTPNSGMPGDAQCFQYDKLQQLITAYTTSASTDPCTSGADSNGGGTNGYWTEYAYDLLGNRTKMTDRLSGTETTYTRGGTSPHQLASMTKTGGSTTNFTWDAAGNQLTGTNGRSQTWDAEGKLATVNAGGATQTNVYDPDGNRLIQKDGTAATVYLPGGQEVRATDTSVSATRWYTFAGHTVAVRTGTGMGGVSSIVTDGHGTPIASVKNTDWNAAVTRIRTDPFGAPRSGQTGTVAGHGFLGAPADTSGLTLLGARFYDPATGTFVSPDPVLDPMNPAQLNAYVYAWNNPITESDPTGLDPQYQNCNTVDCRNFYNNGPSAGCWQLVAGECSSTPSTRQIDDGSVDNDGIAQRLTPVAEPWYGPVTTDTWGNTCEMRTPRSCAQDGLSAVAGILTTTAINDVLMELGGVRRGGGLEAGSLQILTYAGKSKFRPGELWRLGPGPRGDEAEIMLGHNVPPNFRTIDILDVKVGLVASIKTINLANKTYQRSEALYGTLKRYTNSVRDYGGSSKEGWEITPQQIKQRALIVGVPSYISMAQMGALQRAASYASSQGVVMTVVRIP